MDGVLRQRAPEDRARRDHDRESHDGRPDPPASFAPGSSAEQPVEGRFRDLEPLDAALKVTLLEVHVGSS
jgi:hypothetical protein